jgi:hypothetical protein
MAKKHCGNFFLKLQKAINKYNASAVYVATDGDDMIKKFRSKFKNVKTLKLH